MTSNNNNNDIADIDNTIDNQYETDVTLSTDIDNIQTQISNMKVDTNQTQRSSINNNFKLLKPKLNNSDDYDDNHNEISSSNLCAVCDEYTKYKIYTQIRDSVPSSITMLASCITDYTCSTSRCWNCNKQLCCYCEGEHEYDCKWCDEIEWYSQPYEESDDDFESLFATTIFPQRRRWPSYD